VVFRADRLWGPWTPGPANPILTQRDLDPARPHPITSTGHADLVQTAAGEWWAVFLGTRPYAGDLYNTGRETFLLPVEWRDGWPVILPKGAPVPVVARRPDLPAAAALPPTAGDFTLTAARFTAPLAPWWTWFRTSAERWWRVSDGALQIDARPIALGAAAGQPSLIAVRQAHMDAEVQVSVRFDDARAGERAGLAAFAGEANFFALTIGRRADGLREVRLERRATATEPEAGVVVARAPLGRAAGPVRLRVTARGARYGFDYATGAAGWRTLGGAQDGTILSTNKAGNFTGVVIGPYAYGPET
jgi:xylan 1,4-beta-xylosidase